MNEDKYTYVYRTIAPGFMIAYAEWISQLCFGIKPKNNEQYSFMVNNINGHFSYHIHPKYFKLSKTTQNETEAKEIVEQAILNIKEKITKAKDENPNFPIDFPTLFNKNYLKLKTISPVYNEQYQCITSWRALYGFELTVFASQAFGEPAKKTAIESDSLIVEISGDVIIALDYNHTPINARKEVPITPEANAEFIYKKVNQNTLAPYYLTSNGFIPACKDSVAIQTQPIDAGWSIPQATSNGICKSMVTLSSIIEPKDGVPGSAKIVIAMDYKIITLGEGAVDNIGIINANEFEEIYKMGNAPGSINKESLKLKALPTKENPCVAITSLDELKKSRKIDKTTGKLEFWKYFNVTIEYNYKLDCSLGFTLWEGIKWVKGCSFSRGLIYLLPFPAEAENWYYARNNSKEQDIKNSLSDEEKKDCTENDFKIMRQMKIFDAAAKAYAEIAAYIIKNLISENTSKYSNTNLYIDNLNGGGLIKDNSYVFSNTELNNLLNSIGSVLYPERTNDASKPWLNIEEFGEYYKYGVKLLDFAIGYLAEFKKGGRFPENYAAGKLTELIENEAQNDFNYIILNPKLFDKSSLGNKNNFSSLSAAEIIAHEAGHNAATIFFHKYTWKELLNGANDGTYEYNQVGLQSAISGDIYPDLFSNTIGIINDDFNRKNMTII